MKLNTLTNNELIKLIKEIKQEQLNLRIQQQTSQLENPSRLRILKKEIARILTLLNK